MATVRFQRRSVQVLPSPHLRTGSRHKGGCDRCKTPRGNPFIVRTIWHEATFHRSLESAYACGVEQAANQQRVGEGRADRRVARVERVRL